MRKPKERYYYEVFGLTVQSEIKCPELHTTAKTNADVYIRFGSVPEKLDDPKQSGLRFQASEGLFLLKVDGIASYLAAAGSRITVDPLKGSDQRDIRLFLLGSVFGALIHQRGLLPLHASAIKVTDGCVLFCGGSGMGKSTTANAFIKRGYLLHSDDVCVIELNERGYPVVYPGYPQLKLWEDTFEKCGDTSDGFKKVRSVINKYAVPMDDMFNNTPLPLKKLYIISTHNQKTIQTDVISGRNKFNVIKNQTYRFHFTEGLSNRQAHFKISLKLGEQVPFLSVKRPKKENLLNELIAMIETDIVE